MDEKSHISLGLTYYHKKGTDFQKGNNLEIPFSSSS